ncbi:MAG: hypothetical protein AB8I08_15260 [Sandaracinaceae bacterium]
MATLVLCTLATTEARADYVVRVDCYLAHSDLRCPDVVAALEGALPGSRLVSSGDSALSIELRDLEGAQGRRYYVALRGQPVDGEEELAFRISREVPHAAGHDRTLALMVALVQRGIVPFLRVDEPGEVTDGRLTLASQPGETNPPSEPGRWYARPSLSGGYFGGNLTAVSGSAGLDINYSDPEWRWRLNSEARYRYLDIAVSGATLQGDFIQFEGDTVLARSLGSGFSIGAQGQGLREPQNNLDLRARAGLGLEWVLAPFLATNESNVGVRLAGFAVYDRYATTTVNGQRERGYFESRARLFGRLHTDPIDLELSGGVSFLPELPSLWSTWGELEVTARVTQGFAVGLSGSVLYRAGAIHAPADPGLLNTIAATTGSSLGELTMTTELRLSWTLGNSLLRSQDQRWR